MNEICATGNNKQRLWSKMETALKLRPAVLTTSTVYMDYGCSYVYLPWWPSCSDRGALNNVDAPGCGTSVVRGSTGHK